MNVKNKLNEIKAAPNVGTNEQEIRFVAGLVVLLAAATTASVILMLVGVTLLATAYLRWCPAYNKLGKNTCEEGKNVGVSEQNIRYGIGAVVVVAAAAYGSVILLIVGAIIAATAHIRWCPAYYKLGKNTCVADK